MLAARCLVYPGIKDSLTAWVNLDVLARCSWYV
jgi:hypothetical protein